MRKTSTKNNTIKPSVRLAGTGACARAAALIDSLCSAIAWVWSGRRGVGTKTVKLGLLGRILFVCV